MDMQKRLHEQLEVLPHPSIRFCGQQYEVVVLLARLRAAIWKPTELQVHLAPEEQVVLHHVRSTAHLLTIFVHTS